MPRGRNVTVRDRRDWLEQYESGKRLDAIATDAGRTDRTIKEAVDRARSEREVETARVHVLREAFVDHFGDLKTAFKELRGRSRDRSTNELWPNADGRSVLLREALREHLPRSPIWLSCEEWEESKRRLSVQSEQIRADIRDLVQAGLKNSTAVANADGFEVALWAAVQRRADGSEDTQAEFQHDQTTEGISLRVRTVDITNRASGQRGFKAIGQVYQGLLDQVLSDDFSFTQQLGESSRRLRTAMDSITQEVDVLSLRRVFPGQCYLCPGSSGRPTPKRKKAQK